jgi:hypothetical protein
MGIQPVDSVLDSDQLRIVSLLADPSLPHDPCLDVPTTRPVFQARSTPPYLVPDSTSTFFYYHRART